MLWTLPLLAGLLAAASCQPQPLVLPEPRLVILGQTGAGKSTLANVLLGQSPDCSNCTFTVCDGHESCTKNTKYAVGRWLAEGPDFTIVDTPGFGDSDDEDTELIDEMMGVLHTAVKGANAMILLINGEEERFDSSLQQMMREMQALFGEDFWRHTVIGVSHWAYDAQSVAERNFTGKTEEKFMAEWNTLLQGKFHIKEELSGVFIDSWSQQPWNLGDTLQQAAFARETGKLWTFAIEQEVFPFRTIEDVLNENQDLKDENRWLNDVIKNNITELTNAIASLTAKHSEDIDSVRFEHTRDIEELRLEIQEFQTAPIGTITAWTPVPNLDSTDAIPLPEGWVECDGQLIVEGVWEGQKTPDINGQMRFLRGSHIENALVTEEDQVKTHTHNYVDYTYRHIPSGYEAHRDSAGTCESCAHDKWGFKTKTTTGSTGDETRPKNIRVVYIIKIK